MDFTKFICHKRPERTFKYKNHYFPVCARCTGFYLGILFSFIILLLFIHSIKEINLVFYGLILLVPMIIDGITQFLKFRISNNPLRFITGLIGGFGIGILIINILIKINIL